MKIILSGATGFVGGQVLQQALQDSSVEKVTTLARRSLGILDLKLKEIIPGDFSDYSAIKNDIQADACIWCLGVSQNAVSRDEYVKITFDYALAAARAMFSENPRMRFCFLSGSRADHEEKSRVLYGKIKGRTEKELLKLSPNVFNFRPGFILPGHDRRKRPLIARLGAPVASMLALFSDDVSVDCEQVARCLLGVAKDGADQAVLDNRTIRNWTPVAPAKA